MMDGHSIERSLPELLLRLYHQKADGVVTVRDNSTLIRFYLKGGLVIYAGGADKSGQFIKEIAGKRKLNPSEIDELRTIREEDPHNLGKKLIEKKLISENIWNRFLEIKIRNIMASALGMKDPEVTFEIGEPDIPPLNRFIYDTLQLVRDTIRTIRNTELFEELLPDERAVPFMGREQLFPERQSLTALEQKLLAAVDGAKSIKEIREYSGLYPDEFNRNLYLLKCLGLIEYHDDGARKTAARNEYGSIISLYIDLLRVMQTMFRKETGQEFDLIFRGCLAGLPVYSRELLQGLDLAPELQTGVVELISARFTKKGKSTETRLLLTSSFNKILYPLILEMKKKLGHGYAEKALLEMAGVLQYAEKYRGETDMVNYLMANIEDYLKQIDKGIKNHPD